MIKDRERTYQLFQKTLAAAEAAEDWPLYVEASVEYGNSLLTNVNNDATENGQRAWPYLLQAYQKAFNIKDQELCLLASLNLMICTTLMLENLDSNKDKCHTALEAGDFIIAHAPGDLQKFQAAGLQTTILNLKLRDPNKERLVRAAYLELANRVEPDDIDEVAVGGEVDRLLDIADDQKNKGEDYRQTIAIAERFLANFRKRAEPDDPAHRAGNAAWYSFALNASRYFDFLGKRDQAIAYLQEAYLAIEPVSPIDAVNVMTDLAMLHWQDARPDDALEQMANTEGLLQQIWNHAAKKAIEHKINAVKTDLLMLSGYFARHYDFAGQVALESGQLREAVAWREKGLVRFYRALIKGELEQGALIDNDIIATAEQIIQQHPDTLFLHFNSEGPTPVCIAWTATQPIRKIGFESGISGPVLMLQGTEFENNGDFWGDYEAWKRTGSQGRYIRWQHIIEIVSQQIGEYVFKPVLKEFDCSTIKKIVMITNGYLNGVPMQIAKLDGQYLADDFSLVQLPSLLAATMLPQPLTEGIRLIDGLHQDLPWAKAEVAAAKDFFSAEGWQVATGFPETIREGASPFAGLSAAGQTVIHMATHMTYVQEQSSEAAILFNYEGNTQRMKLTDILNDDSLAVPPGSTVILSGCESNQVNFHRNRFLASISRAFLLSGAARVISTSWIVDDSASFFLMGRLYAEWKVLDYQDLAEALRRSQSWLREQTAASLISLVKNEQLKLSFMEKYPDTAVRPFANPFYWGAWAYSGTLN